MCGIAGAVGILGNGSLDALASMHAALAHRGPDAEGGWILPGPADRPRAALQHRRLSILDLSPAGNQPMRDPSTGNVVVFNGEIYNHRALRAELEELGRRFSSRSDTEVLLAAWAAWGTDCLGRLRGMFAFALFDARTREVLLARDRVGKKPLYLCETEDGAGGRALLFASEVRALLATGRVDRRLDRATLATYLWNGYVRGPGTLVRGIRELPAGCFARVPIDEPCVKPQRYWRIPRASGVQSDVRALESELAAAVELRLESDVPLGVFLSGGIDSSAVASLAVRAGRGEVRTFNVAFEETEYDESRHARMVAAQLGTRHEELMLSSTAFRAGLGDALASLDQPTFDGINTWFVSRAVRQAGLKVALAGTGGDELFGGYRSFVDIPRARALGLALHALPEHFLRAAAGLVTRIKLGSFGAVPPQTRWGKLGDVLAARGRLVELYQVTYALFTREFLDELRGKEIEASVRDGLPLEVAQELEEEIRGEPRLAAIARLEIEGFLCQRLLRDTDTTSMSVALEVRAPFVDHRIIEELARLDPRTRFRPLGRKQLLRELALRDLDPALFERPKSGFVLPFERWCRGELEGEVGSALCDRGRWLELGLDPEPVARLWHAFRGGAPGLYWSRVWSLFVLSSWCRRHGLKS